jgi:hypothetical protein
MSSEYSPPFLLGCSCGNPDIRLLHGETSRPGNYAGDNPSEYRYRCAECGAEGPLRDSADGAANGWNMVRSMMPNASAQLPKVS